MKRVNYTVTQMLSVAALADQKDWVQRLPEIEFVLSTAFSGFSGYSSFFLNYGGMLRPMFWDLTSQEILGVQVFIQKLCDALVNAHGAILT